MNGKPDLTVFLTQYFDTHHSSFFIRGDVLIVAIVAK